MKDTFDYTMHWISSLTVHAGVFHADDVFCGAMARIINPDAEIYRVNKAEIDTDVENGIIVADIGFGRFDHHQPDCPFREDGIKHCAASRLWLVYGFTVVKTLCPDMDDQSAEIICGHIYNIMLRTISALDNWSEGFPKDVYSVSVMVKSFTPDWDGEKSYDEGFMDAVEFMSSALTREIGRKASELRAELYVRASLQQMTDGIFILEKYCPWERTAIATPEAKVVVYRSLRGGWDIEAVACDESRDTHRVKTPESWRGKMGDDAAKEMPGMKFCHEKGFVASFTTREYAENAARYLVENCSVS